MESLGHYTFVVIGGGIAGITCAETLATLDDQLDILLITKSDMVKVVSSAVSITRTLTALDVEEVQAINIAKKYPNIKFLKDGVTELNHSKKCIRTENNLEINFEKLCICTGARAKLIDVSNPYVVGIRDTESVTEFEKRIASSRRVMVVGNGGIASEIIYEVGGIDKIWVIKDDYISKTFIDSGAGEFFRDIIEKPTASRATKPKGPVKRIRYTTSSPTTSSNSVPGICDPALGPDWLQNFNLKGASPQSKITFEFNSEVSKILAGDEEWKVRVELTNKKVYGVDLVVSATGVVPNSDVFTHGNESLKVGQDGGIIVDWKMESSLADVFAAGDVATAGWEWAPHWHQMRLWTQARQMGAYAAKCLLASFKNETLYQDFAFELFSHVTKLYGFKVVLLGLFNGQKLNDEYELLLRITKGQEYVKLVIKDGKLQGALLIGETDLEEMCENLILNQLDITPFGDDLLNPDIDIEDYFD